MQSKHLISEQTNGMQMSVFTLSLSVPVGAFIFFTEMLFFITPSPKPQNPNSAGYPIAIGSDHRLPCSF